MLHPQRWDSGQGQSWRPCPALTSTKDRVQVPGLQHFWSPSQLDQSIHILRLLTLSFLPNSSHMTLDFYFAGEKKTITCEPLKFLIILWVYPYKSYSHLSLLVHLNPSTHAMDRLLSLSLGTLLHPVSSCSCTLMFPSCSGSSSFSVLTCSIVSWLRANQSQKLSLDPGTRFAHCQNLSLLSWNYYKYYKARCVRD